MEQAQLCGTQSQPGTMFFGAEFDALRCLPQLPLENQNPGVLNEVKNNGNIRPPFHYVALSFGKLLLSHPHFQLLVVLLTNKHPRLPVFLVFGQERMKQFVWPTGTHNVPFFTGMLLISSTHLDGMKLGQISKTTTAIKLEAMKQFRDNIDLGTSDSLIGCLSAAACLAICALVSKLKVDALAAMVS